MKLKATIEIFDDGTAYVETDGELYQLPFPRGFEILGFITTETELLDLWQHTKKERAKNGTSRTGNERRTH